MVIINVKISKYKMSRFSVIIEVGQVAGKAVGMIDDLLPSAVSSILKSQKEGLTTSLKDGVKAAKKLMDDKGLCQL